MPALELDEPNSEDVAAAQEVFRAWQEGAQDAAIARLRPLADEGRPWALPFISWLYMQRGVPEMAQGIPYAKKAADLGMPWASVNLFNNLMGNAAAFPEGLESALELIAHSAAWWTGIDPVGQGWNLISQGRVADGVRLMSLRNPAASHEWDALTEAARAQAKQVNAVLKSVTTLEAQVNTAAAAHQEAMEKARNDLETSANQAELLITSVTSEATGTLFKNDADQNEEESKTAWIWGLVVLAAAATVAVAPLILHYLGTGPDYSTGALLGAHAGSTAALATVAGVLLARARARDLARQRANDLSIAIATMITFSNQIKDEAERQSFMATMGQLVLQAHLTTSQQGHQTEESRAGLIALANQVRPGSGGSN